MLGVAPEDFHAHAAHLQRDWPTTMTTLSTHDTKRSEDVRARLLAMTELTAEWAESARSWTEAASVYRTSEGSTNWPDPAVVYLLWQTLVGTWDDTGAGSDRCRPAAGLPGEGDPRGQATHLMDPAGSRLRRGRGRFRPLGTGR